jgi:hypothetical protein
MNEWKEGRNKERKERIRKEREKEIKKRNKEERAVDTHQAPGNSKSSHLSNKSTP